MSEIEPRIEIIKKMREKIIEYLSKKKCMVCSLQRLLEKVVEDLE
jgi:hypothetical protein